MKRLFLFVPFIIFSSFFTGCLKDDSTDKEKIVEVTIYPETGYGSSLMSDIWTQTLIFSDNDDNQNRLLVDIIFEEFDFDYERGYKYIFKAKKIWMHEPPQDVSSVKYVFIELLSREKVITENSEEDIELFVSAQTVRFMPRFPIEFEENASTPKIYDALLAKKAGTDDWLVIIEIEGFDFQEGFEYVLNVTKVIQAEPYSLKYRLLNILTKNEIPMIQTHKRV
jgi:hypothetical protein